VQQTLPSADSTQTRIQDLERRLVEHQTQVDALQTRLAELAAQLPRLLSLPHPDKRPDSEVANKATVLLLQLRRRLREGMLCLLI
jgi:hypothetical protein